MDEEQGKSVEYLIKAIPSRAYPLGFTTFASCHESFSEAKFIDRNFYGKTLSEVDLKQLLDWTDTHFLIAEAALYFWPKILLAIYHDPDSQFARAFYGIKLGTWQRWRPEDINSAPNLLLSQEVNQEKDTYVQESNKFVRLINREEKAATYAVLFYARSHTTLSFKPWLDNLDDALVRLEEWQG